MTEEESSVLGMADETQRAFCANRRLAGSEPFARDLFAGNRSVRFECPERADVELDADSLLAIGDAVEVTR